MDVFYEKESDMAEAVTTTAPVTSKAKTFWTGVWNLVVQPVVEAKVSAVASEIQADAAKWDASAAVARAEATQVQAAGSSAVSSATVNKVLVGAGVAGLAAAVALKLFGGRRK